MATFRRRLSASWVLLSIASSAAIAPAHAQSIDSESPERPLSAAVSRPYPNAELPVQVLAPQDQLTLYADFKHPRDDGVVLYLVNRTNQRLAFSAQDGDPYVKLEAAGAAGEFRRAQPHISATCGNSYLFLPTLGPGEFVRFLGYLPKTGKAATVRYRLFQNTAFVLDDDDQPRGYGFPKEQPTREIHIVSNAGPGRAAPEDIENARLDGLALSFGDFDSVVTMATGRAKPTVPYGYWSRNDAVRSLSRFPTDATADLLLTMLDDDEVREEAIGSLAKIGVKNAKAEAAYQRLLGGDRVHLRAIAIAAMSARPRSNETVAFGRARLAENDPVIRTAAITLLVMISEEYPEAKQAVLAHTNDPDPSLRAMVADIHKGWARVAERNRPNE